MQISPQPIAEGGPVKVYVWTDFVCPFCLLGEGLVQQAVAATHARMHWLPFELRPYPAPTLLPEDDYLPRTWREAVYPMATRLGVPIKLPSVSPQPWTRTAFIGMQYALDQHCGNAYASAVLRAFFQQDRDVGKVEVLRDVAQSVGMDPGEFAAALPQPGYARRHDAALALAQRFGVRAVPTILIGD
ncbi:MAG: DsbA family oxidoreductase, partial [Rhodanobacteraceae bacterium]